MPSAVAPTVPPPEVGPLLLSRSQLAGLLGCRITTIDTRWRRGLMPPPIKIGQHVRWPIREIERWIEAGGPPVRKTPG